MAEPEGHSLTDLGRAHHTPIGRTVLIWCYPTPWCGCSVHAGAVVFADGVRCLVERAYVGPVESPKALAETIQRYWGEPVTPGSLCQPWIVALLLRPSAETGIEHPCLGHWRHHIGWSSHERDSSIASDIEAEGRPSPCSCTRPC